MLHLLQILVGSIRLLLFPCGFVMFCMLLLIAACSSVATKRIIRIIDALRRLYNASNENRYRQRIRRRRSY